MESEIRRLPLRERNKQRVIQRIMGAAFELFRRAGYEQTTMDAIAEKAEVSRGTLFNYFPSKSALLIPYAKELYQVYVQPEVLAYLKDQEFREGQADQATVMQALRFLFMSIHEHVLTLPDINRALQEEFLHPRSNEKEAWGGIGFLAHLIMILQYGQRRGEVRSDIALGKLAIYLGVLYMTLFKQLHEQGSSGDYTVEVESLLAFIGSALTPDEKK